MRKLLNKATPWIVTMVLLSLVALLRPPPDPLFKSGFSTVLVSKEGDFLSARIAQDDQWRFPPMDSLPEKYLQSLLLFEDQHFYHHPGINPLSVGRAIYQNIKAGKVVSGGSTLTMQLARISKNNPPRTLWNKLEEIVLAFRMELYMSKEEILRQYAAHAPFGGNVVGLEAASWRYFGRSPFDLSWAESASLAVLPNAPGLIYPGSRDQKLVLKRNRLLYKLKKKGWINPLDYDLSCKEEPPGKPETLPDLSPHLMDRVITEHAKGKYYKSTLDYDIQVAVNEIVNKYYSLYRDREIHNMAIYVSRISDNETVAYAGNTRPFNDQDHGQQVDIITSKRSPGSLLKPVLYSMALDEGLISPDQLLPDIPLYYQGFVPQNFNKEFKGAVPASRALQSSLNIPFVDLLKDYGYEKMHSKLQSMGISSLNREAGHYGLTLILGGGEISLWEICNLYSGLARTLNGYNESKGSERYTNDVFKSADYLFSDNQSNGSGKLRESKISAGSIWLMLDVMEDLVRPGMRSHWKNYASAKAVSWKTGTSYGHKDAWSVGLNSEFVVGVWVGNADGEGRSDLVGAQIAAPVMFEVFEKLENKFGSSESFSAPLADMHMDKICEISGFRAGEYCDKINEKWLPNSIQQSPTCPFHKPIHLDASGQYQVNSSCYPIQEMKKENWFILPAAQSWYFRKHNHQYREPPGFLSSCKSNNEDIMELVYPKKWAKVFIPIEIDGSPGKVIFEAAHQNPESSIYWHLDNEFIGQTQDIHQIGVYPSKGIHLLSLLDENGRDISVNFEVLN